MRREDFIKLIGAEAGKADFLPVACLLKSGYGCLGHYNSVVNEDLEDTCVLLNARLIDIKRDGDSSRPAIHDFNEFLEEIVSATLVADAESVADEPADDHDPDAYGRTIPLMAIALSELAVVYPVAHIGRLVQRAKEERWELPTFFDLDKSLLLRVLRTKLW